MGESLKYHMRLRVYRTGRSFGPGVSSLMKLVEERGSLSAACKEMGMAYSKAWRIIKAAEDDLGFPLMEGQSGGESGGRTILTERGKAFLDRYLKFEDGVRQQAEILFLQYFGEDLQEKAGGQEETERQVKADGERHLNER